MLIGVTSQNFRSITAHAGKTRRFLIFEADATGNPVEIERWDLTPEMSLHGYTGDEPHPLAALDALITGSCGAPLVARLKRMGVRLLQTTETDPGKAAGMLLRGEPLPGSEASDHTEPASIILEPTLNPRIRQQQKH